MSSARDQRIVIAGASSLLGVELKSLLEEGRFASWDFSLVDEETSVGTLTEAAGEPAIIQPVEESSFARAKLIFFTGSTAFTQRNLSAARESRAFVIDLSGGSLKEKDVHVWFAVEVARGDADKGQYLFAIPSAPGFAAAKLMDALGALGASRLSMIFLRPVSEAGKAGIEELESQTSQLLSFQSVGQPVFDTQVAFNLLDAYGAESREKLVSTRERIALEVSIAAQGKSVQPSVQVLHAPVFYGYTFVGFADLDSKPTGEGVIDVCGKAGFAIDSDSTAPLGNLNAAGESSIHLAAPQADSAHPGSWWFWGAADNIRLPAAYAIKLAEKLAV